MKHLPNLLTLANLFCGCIAIAFALNSQPFQILLNGTEYYYVTGTEQACLASLFIALATFFDLLDGFAARMFKIHSPIGMDLDSLADVVSFGVAPSMILFKMLWASWMSNEGALDVPMLAMSPAFLVACFAALRLAKFNITPPTKSGSFTGMPTPATGFLVASFPLINYYNLYGTGSYLEGKWTIYFIIAVLCGLMVSQIRFFKFIPYQWNLASTWRQLVLIAVVLISFPFIKAAAIPLSFIFYIILSIVSRETKTI